jgi:hypothetical protein
LRGSFHFRYLSEIVNEKMAALEAATAAASLSSPLASSQRPKSAAAGLKAYSHTSSSAAPEKVVIDGWLKDFENQRKHFRSLFLHGEHVLMQVLLLLLLLCCPYITTAPAL